MEHIEYFDLIHSNPNKRRDVVNEEWTIYDAYESSVAASSPILNFYKIINDNEVPKLVDKEKFLLFLWQYIIKIMQIRKNQLNYEK